MCRSHGKFFEGESVRSLRGCAREPAHHARDTLVCKVEIILFFLTYLMHECSQLFYCANCLCVI